MPRCPARAVEPAPGPGEELVPGPERGPHGVDVDLDDGVEAGDPGAVGVAVGVFFVRRDSPVKTLRDLAGHSVAFQNPYSTSAYYLPAVQLLEAYGPKRFAGELRGAGVPTPSVLQGGPAAEQRERFSARQALYARSQFLTNS